MRCHLVRSIEENKRHEENISADDVRRTLKFEIGIEPRKTHPRGTTLLVSNTSAKGGILVSDEGETRSQK